MTYELFWLEDVNLVKSYRKAFELRREMANQNAWLMGCYVYDALCAVSPVLNAFAKRGTKPMPYHKEPYPLKKSKTESPAAEESSVGDAKLGAAKFHSFAAQLNKRFENSGT
ncbi:MAG TPA: hypothetical protein GXZ77_09270 [Papillibacter sp.]|nr:hypothetical protein [Papillibacter sp.]